MKNQVPGFPDGCFTVLLLFAITATVIIALVFMTATAKASILSGGHQAATVLAQGYGPAPYRVPQFSRPYEYDRPYRGPYREPDVVYPDERQFNQDMGRFRRYERPYGPHRPY